jgi:hypothetical protein
MVTYSNALRNAVLDSYDTHFPAGSKLQLRSGAPAGAGNPASGTLLAEVTLPPTPWLAASNGQKELNGLWSAAVGTSGTIGHFRLINGTKVEEGTVSASGGGGDMILNTVTATLWRVITVLSFTKTL